MLLDKQTTRLRRAKKTRMRIRSNEIVRLCIHRTPKHMYAQVTTSDGATVIASASTLDKTLREKLKSTGNVDAAQQVGTLIAERALKAGIKKIAFDRSGYCYHGRVKALADAAREGGLDF